MADFATQETQLKPCNRYGICDYDIVTNEQRRTRSGFQKVQNRNPFFFRNNPHPNRVRHIKGLLDFPICAVQESGYREGGTKMLQKEILMSTMKKNGQPKKRRETFVPGIGIVSVEPTWLQQLRVLATKLNDGEENGSYKMSKNNAPEPLRRSSRHSRRPLSQQCDMRQMENDFVRVSCSRQGSRGKVKTKCKKEWQSLELNKNEAYVAELLSEILNTDSLEVIKYWLMEAPEKEREEVLEMIRAASNTNREFREVMTAFIGNKNENKEEAESSPKISPRTESRGKKLNGLDTEPCEISPRILSREKERDYNMLDVIAENLEADLHTMRQSSREEKIKNFNVNMFPKISNEVSEIEVLRSRLASRSNVNVLRTTSRSSRSRSSAR